MQRWNPYETALNVNNVGRTVEVEVDLVPDTRLVFYSDGITEAENPHQEEYGPLRLQQHLLQPEASAGSLIADVHSFADGLGLRDDATVIVVEMRGQEVASWESGSLSAPYKAQFCAS